MGMNPEIDQNESDDLVYDLSKMPGWCKIPYISGGLYDRIQENLRQHTNQPLLTEQDEYQWFRRPSSNINNNITTCVELLKPGVKETDYSYIMPRSESNKLMLPVHLAFYDSATDINIHAVTWTSTSFAVKPIKILKHDWHKITFSDVSRYKCTECGLTGSGRFFTANYASVKSAICPDRLLTCEQEVVRDIIV